MPERASHVPSVARSIWTIGMYYHLFIQHILSEAHKVKVRQNAYNDHIMELIASCELEHRLEPEDSEQTDAELKVISIELGYKPKKQRKAEKLASKQLTIQQHTSIFTDAYRQQQRTPSE